MSLRKIGELDILLFGVSARLDPVAPVVPKGIASGVRVLVNTGGRALEPVELTSSSAPRTSSASRACSPVPGCPCRSRCPWPMPPTSRSAAAAPARSAEGRRLHPHERAHPEERQDGARRRSRGPRLVKVIDQILVTSVKTRPLTLSELEDAGHHPRQQLVPGLRVHPRPAARVEADQLLVPGRVRQPRGGRPPAAVAAAVPGRGHRRHAHRSR